MRIPDQIGFAKRWLILDNALKSRYVPFLVPFYQPALFPRSKPMFKLILAILVLTNTAFAQETGAHKITTAVVVGVSEFAHFQDQGLLRPEARALCENNAIALREVLGNESVIALCNPEQATRAGILASLAKARQLATGHGIMFIYLGIGVGSDFGDPSLLAYDTEATLDGAMNTALRVADLEQVLGEGPIIALVDATLDIQIRLEDTVVAARGPIASDLPADWLAMSAISTTNQVPADREAFGNALSSAWHLADANGDRVLGAEELFEYMLIQASRKLGFPPGVRGDWKREIEIQLPIIPTIEPEVRHKALLARPHAPKWVRATLWGTGGALALGSGIAYGLAWREQSCLQEACYDGQGEYDAHAKRRNALLLASQVGLGIALGATSAGFVLLPQEQEAHIEVALRW